MVFSPQHRIFVPAIYILTTGKLEALYKRIFFEIDHLLNDEWKPKFIISDFEISFVNTFKKIFPFSQHRGCYFHFKQAIQKNMKKLGISRKCAEQIHIDCAKLSLLPVANLEQAVTLLKRKYSTNPKAVQFWNYFERVWMRKYSPTLWNISKLDLTFKLTIRTNNILERYNKKMNEALPSHGKITGLIDFLSDESEFFEMKCDAIAQGDMNIRKVIQPDTIAHKCHR